LGQKFIRIPATLSSDPKEEVLTKSPVTVPLFLSPAAPLAVLRLFSSKTVALFPFRFPIVINAAHLMMLVFRNIFGLRSDKRICPKCSSQEIYLSHRKNHFEKSLSVFLIRPFRCQQCHRRFWKFISPNSQMLTGRPSDLQKS
jgi:hypothetical protein